MNIAAAGEGARALRRRSEADAIGMSSIVRPFSAA
jgi:hypothetical protein